MAGRPPKPTGAKILAGTFRPCRANPDEPEPEILLDIPSPPRKLKLEARREWDRVIEFVIKNRIVGSEGLSPLATYCNLHAAIVAEEKKGNLLTASLLAQYRALADSFGLTGSGRAKLHPGKEKPKQDNPWQGLARNS